MNAVKQFANYIIKHNPDFSSEDFYLLQNQILEIIGIKKIDTETKSTNLDEMIEELSSNPINQSELYALTTPKSSTINQIFWDKYRASGTKDAIAYYRKIMINNHYLQTDLIKRNRKFDVNSPYGKLQITINLAKPEKTVAEIAAAKNQKNTCIYPKCQLCFENEGYLGGDNYPLRKMHRIIRLNLDNHPWGMQFSPYEYFDEHVIIMNKNHVPMAITPKTFKNLFDFVDQFPNYFIGSNADLPIVGGSMLAHDHYQGGKHIFPVEQAQSLMDFQNSNNMQISLLNWPVTTMRLISTDRDRLINLATKIFAEWNEYSNHKLHILAQDEDKTRHHTINPIVRKDGSNYVLYVMLRDNNTSEKFPSGIFHAHPEYFHIKQENIGLIEAMGLAILPGRLAKEMIEVKKYLLNQPSDVLQIHQKWADEIKSRYHNQDIDGYVENEIGEVFQNILENVGVFKLDDQKQVSELAKFIHDSIQ